MGVVVAVGRPAEASGANAGVRVEGGADTAGHTYTWTISNLHDSPVVAVEFPHQHASLFRGPDGWTTDDSTNLVGVGAADKPGICVAAAASPSHGIAPGGRAVFTMQIGPRGSRRGTGSVVVRFADGTETTVEGVELPIAESLGDKYVSLIGLGIFFLIAVAIQALRSRRRRRTPAT